MPGKQSLPSLSSPGPGPVSLGVSILAFPPKGIWPHVACAWLLSLNAMTSRFIPAVLSIRASLLSVEMGLCYIFTAWEAFASAQELSPGVRKQGGRLAMSADMFWLSQLRCVCGTW